MISKLPDLTPTEKYMIWYYLHQPNIFLLNERNFRKVLKKFDKDCQKQRKKLGLK